MIRDLKKVIALVTLLILTLPTLAFASEQNVVRIQGTVMEVDIKKNVMVVNEITFVFNQSTTIQNEKGTPMQMEKLKPKTWVYVEGKKTNNRTSKVYTAGKVYLLPKYIGKKERPLYPFIQ